MCWSLCYISLQMEKVSLWLKNNWKQKLMVTLVLLGIGFVFEAKEPKVENKIVDEVKSEVIENNIFEYKGRDGIDALTLLREKTAVEQDGTGMVVSINGRKADNEKREFWGFYVNGEMAVVGSAGYQTKNDDIIDWKIENY